MSKDQQRSIACCRKVLRMVGTLHARGFQQLRIFPYAREMWWRCEIAPGALFDAANGACMETRASSEKQGLVARVSSGDGCHLFGWKEDIGAMSIAKMSDMFLDRFPAIAAMSQGADWAYAGWYQEMLLKLSSKLLPIAYSTDAYESVVYDRLRLDAPNGASRSLQMSLPPLYPKAKV